jgi:hypothetical protein
VPPDFLYDVGRCAARSFHVNTFLPFLSHLVPLRRRYVPHTALSRLARYVSLFCLASALHGCGLTQNKSNRQDGTNPDSPRPAAQKPTPSTSQAAQGQATRGQAKIDPAQARPALEAWAKAFSDWAGGTRAPQTISTTAPVQRKPVYVDVMAVARRHPAWQLAAALERNEVPVRLRAVEGPQRLPRGGELSVRMAPLTPLNQLNIARFNIPRAPLSGPEYSSGNAPGSLQPASVTAGSLTPGSLVPFTQQAAQRVTASGLSALQENSRQRQRAAIENFLALAEQRGEIELEGRAADLRGALEESISAEVEAFQRSALAPVATTLPPPAVQLEMTNLRLRLQNLRLSEAERGQARARLNELEAQWIEELRAQEEAQLAQLEQSRRELPLQRRREGSVAVNQTLTQLRTAGQDEREAVRTRLLALLGQDFTQDETMLGIVLPPITSPFGTFPALPVGPSTRAVSRSVLPGSMIIETPAWKAASNREIGAGISSIALPVASPVQRTAQVSALRAQAIREARLWTRIVARRQGWQLQEVRTARTQPQSTPSATPPKPMPTTDGTGTSSKDFEFRLAFANIR